MKNLGLTYCTNVHPLGDWASWRKIIGNFGPAIRSDLGWKTLPMGLWFPAALVAEMGQDPETSRRLIKELFQEKGLSAFTCNAFPFGNFHDKVVKTAVYHPDWTKPERLEYTVACARILAEIMPKGNLGSISTLPLGWRMGWKAEHTQAAARNLIAFAQAARTIANEEGRVIRLGIEPEPGCVLETTDQVVDFWNNSLRPAAKASGLTREDLDAFCGICYDTCHQAVQFENPIEVLGKLQANSIPIAKIQLSSALEFKTDPAQKSISLRTQFVEERFLHQTRIRTPQGVMHFDDLPEALAAARKDQDLWSHPWRVHFHLPIDATDMIDPAWVTTTRDDMLTAYQHAIQHNLCHHFEVETYTWSVLPEAHRPSNDAELASSIARELRFISERLPTGVVANDNAGNGVAHG